MPENLRRREIYSDRRGVPEEATGGLSCRDIVWSKPAAAARQLYPEILS